MQRKLLIPVLWIGGRHNAGEMVGQALSLVANHVATKAIEGAGHWVSDENPEALTESLLEFFG
jgi:pimeloyl-ACP methyl ester carboxylesterase